MAGKKINKNKEAPGQKISLKKQTTVLADKYVDKESETDYRYFHNFSEIYPLVHDHDYYEVFLVIKGKCYHWINDEVILLSQGQMTFIRVNDVHKFERYDDNAFNAINLAFREKALIDLQDFLGNAFELQKLLSAPLPPQVILTDEQMHYITNLMEQVHTTPHNEKDLIKMRLRALLVEIFARYFSYNPYHSFADRPFWLEILLQVFNKPVNFTKGMKRLLEMACKSQEHLCRMFKQYLHITPSVYINEFKLTYASNQPLHSDKSISDIAFDSGFENQGYFYNTFKRKFGITPLQFRNQNRKMID